MKHDETHLEQYRQDGYCIIPQFASEKEVEDLKAGMQSLLPEISEEQFSVFSTSRQETTSDRYFLESGDKVRCFYEDAAVLPGEKAPPVNKVGHALHDRIDVYRAFSYQDKMRSLAEGLGIEKPAIIQSQYIFKRSGVGGEVRPHDDSTFIYTDPQTCVGLWLALDPATVENGCLWALPGSHREAEVIRRFVRNSDGASTSFIEMGGMEKAVDLAKGIPLEAKPGDLVLLHGSLVHWSQKNESDRSRNAFVLHLIDQVADYPSDNWLQRSADYPIQNL